MPRVRNRAAVIDLTVRVTETIDLTVSPRLEHCPPGPGGTKHRVWECAICLVDTQLCKYAPGFQPARIEVRAYLCGHAFHRACAAYLTNTRCPTCKQDRGYVETTLELPSHANAFCCADNVVLYPVTNRSDRGREWHGTHILAERDRYPSDDDGPVTGDDDPVAHIRIRFITPVV